jgi:transposase
MSPYPLELRTRVVAAAEEGEHSIPEVARLFNVGVFFVKKMLRLSRAGEDLAPRHGGGGEPLLKEKELAFLRQEVEKLPDSTLDELQTALDEKCGVKASHPTISRALKQLNLPRKKKVLSIRNGTKRRAKNS